MARAYSDDLREKVLGAYASGRGTLRELAERFEVSYGWVRKIRAVERETGIRQRMAQRRRPSAVDTEQVRRLIRNKPDLVLRELQHEMLKSGQRFSIAQLWRVVGKLGLMLKKSLHATERGKEAQPAEARRVPPADRPGCSRRPDYLVKVVSTQVLCPGCALAMCW